MKWKAKHLFGAILGLLTLAIAGEFFARLVLGLGSPPLTVTHSRIEYMFKPNQDLYRFGNHIFVNGYGMRTQQFPRRKRGVDLRIMVFGDSVVNGGSLTDQADLATTRLERSLTELVGRDVIVGNISAGSWGPGNWLAYAEEYGLFDADVVIVVCSSHDFADNPSFAPLNSGAFPRKRPVSALFEGLFVNLPRYLSARDTWHPPEAQETAVSGVEIAKGLKDLQQFLDLAQREALQVLVFQHVQKSELLSGVLEEGYWWIRKACLEAGIVPVSLGPYFRSALDSGFDPYRDNLHPNSIGQRIMAQAMMEHVASSVANKDVQRARGKEPLAEQSMEQRQ
ncbi:hypothetical protein BH24PSE2_BH24PSE2_18920 [soil metagenome]